MPTKKTKTKGEALAMLSARVSSETIEQINTLKDKTKTTQAWVISFAVQRLYDEWIEGGISNFVSEILGGLDMVKGATYTMELDDKGRVSKIERHEEG